MTEPKTDTLPLRSGGEDKAGHINRSQRYFIIWTVIFGVTLGLGGSALQPFPIPFLGITADSPLVALMITLNKMVVRRRLSVTAMYCVVTILASFTSYLGPPSLLKPIFILAAFTFDAGTFFRTDNLRFWNVAVGHAAVTISGFAAFWLLVKIHVPATATVVGKALVVAAPIHIIQSVIVAAIVWKALPFNAPPPFIKRIQEQLGAVDDV